MRNENKNGIFSSMFGRNKKNQEAEEAAEREARQKLQQRIEQALAEVVPQTAEMSVVLHTEAERNAA